MTDLIFPNEVRFPKMFIFSLEIGKLVLKYL